MNSGKLITTKKAIDLFHWILDCIQKGVTIRLIGFSMLSSIVFQSLYILEISCLNLGGGVSESTDEQGCAILALEVVPKNLIST